MLDPVERMLIERECTRLTVEYCHFVDHGEASKIAGQFTRDGVWTSGETTMTGQNELRAGFGRRQALSGRRSRHVCDNVLIHVIDEDNATGVVYLTLYRHDDPQNAAVRPSGVPAIVGEYRDRFVRTSEGWRFARREVVVDFAARPPA